MDYLSSMAAVYSQVLRNIIKEFPEQATDLRSFAKHIMSEAIDHNEDPRIEASSL
jgi:hypothetical protein